ncbi:hypothetical protein BACUNI_02198 [Bacteroides uniformis ATCC 8492]|uniref:Uncharacterized protein n=1 Tax=Bacteroides uniformis (strain ATCC 8492 / DSM 6597 / CCUG 4942 / CIP 103695 / JCM 5828 / KCTC 5204 / NCTC 13054 / VPI 0061) TaxID=411479 RepID=A0ABC9NBV5_BACUC|nr:hypothetical protein BACUNI_02198 [Bacteroides uniformis ATCC 8492]
MYTLNFSAKVGIFYIITLLFCFNPKKTGMSFSGRHPRFSLYQFI